MEHEGLVIFTFESIDPLLVLGGAECSNDEGLRFTSRKEG